MGVIRLVLLLLAAFALIACERTMESGDSDTEVSLLEGMGGSPDPGFDRATVVREFVFPQDHGPHPGFATEWWYFTGNLFDDQGRRFGYQLTLFRIGLAPDQPEQDSDWRAHEMYMGHFAVSDVLAEKHYQAERFSRAAAGLAGAQANPMRVWLGPWSINGKPGDTFPLQVNAVTDDLALELEIDEGAKRRVLQGDRGLSQKSGAPGNASYYYSYTRLPTKGTISIGKETFEVSGNSWFDREWSSSALADDQAGWDWFALQLDDGRDLMFYRMRGTDGEAQPFSKGVLVGLDGSADPLRLEDVVLESTREWRAPDGRRYPIAWTLAVPNQGLDLAIEASFEEQQMQTTVRYWEGAVDVIGTHTGVGYLEMSGYSVSQD